ncbi:MAG: type II secretion system protein [Acidobacteriota bacterium]
MSRPHRIGRREFGLTLVELIVAFTIMMFLTALSLPLARYKVRREKERELRYALRELRSAIDRYKDTCEKGGIEKKLGAECYPESLEQLVEGVKLANDPTGKKIRFLRRIPRDPFTNSTDWGLRSTQDDPRSTAWGGQNIFDVYTKSMERAPDGTPYSEW